MAFNPKEYPSNWKEIVSYVRQRSGDRCEGSYLYPDCRAINGLPHPVTGSHVVLTTAHFPDRTKTNCDLNNLRHLCQRCHLAIDREYHVRKRKENRAKRLDALLPRLELE
jgi:hypothetical protein